MENTDTQQSLTPPPPQVPEPTEQTPPSVPPVPPAPEQPKPRKRSVWKILLVIFGVLLLIFLLGAAFIIYQLQSKGLTMDKISPKAVPTSTVTKSNNTTSDYKNNAYKFSMPIASDLKIKESPYGFGVTSVEMRAADTPQEYGPDFQILVFPKAIGEQIGQDFNKYYDFAPNTTQEIKDPAGSVVKFTKVKNRSVGGLRGFEFTSIASPAEPDIEPEIGVYIELGTDTMVISTPESNRTELETMLTDFKYPL